MLKEYKALQHATKAGKGHRDETNMMIYLQFITVHLVHDSLVVLGAMGNRSVQGVTNFHLLHFLDHSLQELIMDTPLHEQTTYRNIQCHDTNILLMILYPVIMAPFSSETMRVGLGMRLNGKEKNKATTLVEHTSCYAVLSLVEEHRLCTL